MALIMLLGIQCRCFDHSVRAYGSIHLTNLRAYFIKIFHSELCPDFDLYIGPVLGICLRLCFILLPFFPVP